MSFSIKRALRSGLDRVVSRNGALLTGAYMILFLVYQASFNGLIAEVLPAYLPVDETATEIGFTYTAPVAVYALVVLLMIVGISMFTIIAIRTFVSGRTDSIPERYYTRRLLWATLNLIVGGLAFGFIVLVGSLLLIIPGIVAYVGLVFMTMYIAVEDENFIAAIRQSWRLVRPEFFSVLGLLLVAVVGIGIATAILGFIVGFGANAIGGEGIAGMMTGVLNAPFTLILLAVLSAAFDQLRETDEFSPA